MAIVAKTISTLSAVEIGRVLGISKVKVEELAVQGVLPRAGRGLYDLSATVQAFIRHKTTTAQKGDPTMRGLMLQRSRLAKTRADQAELEQGKRTGEFLVADDVAAAWLSVTAIVRTKLLSIPTKTAAQLAGKTAPECAAITKKAIYEALTEISHATI